MTITVHKTYYIESNLIVEIVRITLDSGLVTDVWAVKDSNGNLGYYETLAYYPGTDGGSCTITVTNDKGTLASKYWIKKPIPDDGVTISPSTNGAAPCWPPQIDTGDYGNLCNSDNKPTGEIKITVNENCKKPMTDNLAFLIDDIVMDPKISVGTNVPPNNNPKPPTNN